mmetsp:Transcript_8948/g.27701  ORF Transcript_8948/g.27701 Transcript_8948/m.27701 type:complete len:251 (-) Transcript_8948:18-770(-)
MASSVRKSDWRRILDRASWRWHQRLVHPRRHLCPASPLPPAAGDPRVPPPRCGPAVSSPVSGSGRRSRRNVACPGWAHSGHHEVRPVHAAVGSDSRPPNENATDPKRTHPVLRLPHCRRRRRLWPAGAPCELRRRRAFWLGLHDRRKRTLPRTLRSSSRIDCDVSWRCQTRVRCAELPPPPERKPRQPPGIRCCCRPACASVTSSAHANETWSESGNSSAGYLPSCPHRSPWRMHLHYKQVLHSSIGRES